MMWCSRLSLLALPAFALAFANVGGDGVIREPGILRFPLQTSERPGGLARRQNEVASTAYQSGYLYTIDVTIGTPGQTLKLHFDTGSAETWVNPDCSTSGEVEFCQSFARFDSSKSSTFVDLKETSEIKYGTGSAQIKYAEDMVAIGSAKITKQKFGIATKTDDSSTGLIGAGPDGSSWDNSYPLVLDNLAAQGFINSRAFSMDLRGIGSPRGSVIFGGIDTRKFSGPLEKRSIVPQEQAPEKSARYWVYLDGLSVTQEDGTKVTAFSQTNGQVVLLDSGYSISTLPGPIFQGILKAFPSANKLPNSGQYSVDCAVANQKGTVDFTFGKTVIKVPYLDFLANRGDVCILGIEEDAMPVLGDTFLRAAYVVYDYDNREIHLANNEDCGSKLIPIGNGPNAVPALVGECNGSNLITTTSTTSTTSSLVSSTSKATTTTTSSESKTTSSTVSSTSKATTSSVSSTSSVQTTSSKASSTSSATTATTSSESKTSDTKTSTTSGSSTKTSGSTTASTSNAQTTTQLSTQTSSVGATSTSSGSTAQTSASQTTSTAAGSTTGASSSQSSTVKSGTSSAQTSASTASTSAASTSDITSSTSGTTGGVTTSASVTLSSSTGSGKEITLSGTSVTARSSLPPSFLNTTTSVTSTVSVTTTELISTPATLTSTIITSKVYTITSCPPEVKNCPIGSVTTQVITSLTTYCPKPTPTSPPTLTSTITTSKIYTITSCPPEVKMCPIGFVTTQIITSLTTYCPGATTTPRSSISRRASTYSATKTFVVTSQTSAKIPKTQTVYQTVTCGKSTAGCQEGSTKVITGVVTKSLLTATARVPTNVQPLSSAGTATKVTQAPSVTNPPPVVAGAHQALPQLAGVLAGIIIAAAM